MYISSDVNKSETFSLLGLKAWTKKKVLQENISLFLWLEVIPSFFGATKEPQKMAADFI